MTSGHLQRLVWAWVVCGRVWAWVMVYREGLTGCGSPLLSHPAISPIVCALHCSSGGECGGFRHDGGSMSCQLLSHASPDTPSASSPCFTQVTQTIASPSAATDATTTITTTTSTTTTTAVTGLTTSTTISPPSPKSTTTTTLTTSSPTTTIQPSTTTTTPPTTTSPSSTTTTTPTATTTTTLLPTTTAATTTSVPFADYSGASRINLLSTDTAYCYDNTEVIALVNNWSKYEIFCLYQGFITILPSTTLCTATDRMECMNVDCQPGEAIRGFTVDSDATYGPCGTFSEDQSTLDTSDCELVESVGNIEGEGGWTDWRFCRGDENHFYTMTGARVTKEGEDWKFVSITCCRVIPK